MPITGRPEKVGICRINKMGCWEWVGGKSTYYPTIICNNKVFRLSRLMLQAKLGRSLQDKMEACHVCDNPPCLNPEHLFEGTHKENMLDRTKKGRGNTTKGSKNYFHKITEKDVVRIRQLAASGVKHREIGRMFGISQDHVRKINTKKLWKHVA